MAMNKSMKIVWIEKSEKSGHIIFEFENIANAEDIDICKTLRQLADELEGKKSVISNVNPFVN